MGLEQSAFRKSRVPDSAARTARDSVRRILAEHGHLQGQDPARRDRYRGRGALEGLDSLTGVYGTVNLE